MRRCDSAGRDEAGGPARVGGDARRRLRRRRRPAE